MEATISQTSGLPKPSSFNRLSKLPTPGSSLPAPAQYSRPPSPERPQQSSIRPPLVSPIKTGLQRPVVGSVRGKSTIPGASRSGLVRPQSTIVTAQDAALIRPQTPVERQPLSSIARPQSRQASSIARTPVAPLGSAYQYKRPGTRHPSDEENKISQTDSSDPDSSPSSSKGGSVSGAPVSRKSRPSLSDRTVESLSNVPPSPATTRRQSGFFGAPGQTPTNPGSRPPSSFHHVKHPSSSVLRGSSIAGPTSPSKRPVSSYGLPTPSKGSFGSSTGLPSTKSGTTASKITRPQSSAAIRTPVAGSHVRSKTATTTKPTAIKPVTSIATKPTVTKTSTVPPRTASLKPPSITPRPLKRTAAPAPQAILKPENPDQEDSGRLSTPSSSADLRDKISMAKAASKEAMSKAKAAANERSALEFDAEAINDPFNLLPRDGKGILRKRIDDARRDGKLNIAAMQLEDIPDEVFKMYDADAMGASSIPWSECVDLVKLIAADNEFRSLPDSMFPASSLMSVHDTADEDPKANQFGGLDLLDLHGNMLERLPTGVVHLTRLTTLNLSRNRLENSALETICQISTLKDLNLAFNDLAENLTPCISQLEKLESLQVQGNKLKSLPESICDLRSLRMLNVADNRLTSLPFVKMTKKPDGNKFEAPGKELKELHAANNALTGSLFSDIIESLPKLELLDVANNSLATLSFLATFQLPRVLRLDVSNNRLYLLPPIGRWTLLTAFLAEGNCLTELPAGFTDLGNLRTANFIGNSLTELPESIAQMKKLETLMVAGNPLANKKFLTLGAQQIKLEMERRLENAKSIDEAFDRPSAVLEA